MDQAALAIERVRLVEDLDRAKRTAETDRLRSALLTSISHDLKTPLAAVLGSAGTLRELVGCTWTTHEKADLLATIIDESERLNRFIANLLDMTKLESGAVVPNAALHDLGEIVGSALRRAGKILGAASGRGRPRQGLADGGDRSRAVRAGPVQPARTMRPNMRRPAPPSASRAGETANPSACRSWTKATAFRPTIWSISSTSSIGRRRATTCARGPGLGSRFPAASSRRCNGTIVAANRTDRTGAVFTIRLPVPADDADSWTPPHDRRPAQSSGDR